MKEDQPGMLAAKKGRISYQTADTVRDSVRQSICYDMNIYNNIQLAQNDDIHDQQQANMDIKHEYGINNNHNNISTNEEDNGKIEIDGRVNGNTTIAIIGEQPAQTPQPQQGQHAQTFMDIFKAGLNQWSTQQYQDMQQHWRGRSYFSIAFDFVAVTISIIIILAPFIYFATHLRI